MTAQQRMPNFFIVGAPKAGTTSLYEYLNSTTGVYMSPVKEPSYFSPAVSEDYAEKVGDLDAYLRLFRGAEDERAIGEATPFYLWDPESPQLIREASPEAKIIATLRDPVERAFSDYLMMSAHYGSERLSFPDALQANASQPESRWGERLYLELGEYSEQVQRYLDVFGESNVKVVLFEDLVSDTANVVNGVLRFLAVPGALDVGAGQAHNSFSIPKTRLAQRIVGSEGLRRLAQRFVPATAKDFFVHKFLLAKAPKPQMTEEAREFLQEYYREDARSLQSKLHRRLPWPWIEG